LSRPGSACSSPERPEVMLAHEQGRGSAHGIDVQRGGQAWRPAIPALERRRASFLDAVDVSLAGARQPRVEGRFYRRHTENLDRVW
jgi:hypothetical protein